MKKVLTILIGLICLTQLALTRYYDADMKPKASMGQSEYAYALYCPDKQDWNDSANVANLVFDQEAKTVRFKTEAEKMPMLIPGKVIELYQYAQAYVKSKGYDEVTLLRMSVFLTSGNDAQKALCQQVLDFTDKVTKEGYFTRKAQAEACTKIADLNAISLDYSNFDTDDPKVTLVQVEQAQ
jgi:uncharacterized protein YxeA